jgi:hypothetical protein
MLKIFGHLYEVKYRDMSTEEYHGRAVFTKGVIEIDSSINSSRQEETLLHETLHHVSNLLCLGMKEELVHRLAVGLHTIIIDNPEVFSLDLPVDKEEMN